jgi:hypothetical protein
MKDVASRLTNRVQIPTDGFHCYLNAVDAAFPHGIDYAMLVKMYGTDPMEEKPYSPSICLSSDGKSSAGVPIPNTSTLRMSSDRIFRCEWVSVDSHA